MTVSPIDDSSAAMLARDLQAVNEAAAAEEVRPIEETQAAGAARAVDAVATAGADYDNSTISNTARELARQAIAEAGSRASSRFGNSAYQNPDPLESMDSPAVRELVASFADYDNGAAVSRYDNYLDVFTSYGTVRDIALEENAAVEMRTPEYDAFRNLGINLGRPVTREIREGIVNQVDAWLDGSGVFRPDMLGYPGSEGFRFLPLTEEARRARSAADVMSAHEKNRIAAYLREMALLRPGDFLFYDPTGLGFMSRGARRNYLERIEQLLTDVDVEADAIDFAYAFNSDGTLNLSLLGRELDENERRLQELVDANRDLAAEGIVAESLRLYNAGVVTGAFG